MIKIEPFSYEQFSPLPHIHSGPARTPVGYVCSKCGMAGVKLWRHYQTCLDYQSLFCAFCAEADQGKTYREYGRSIGDSIGWLVPAVPTEDGTTFWGYTSIPSAGCFWWFSLLSRPNMGAVLRALEESVKLQSHYAQLLNGYDGGKRTEFANAAEWLARLAEVDDAKKH